MSANDIEEQSHGVTDRRAAVPQGSHGPENSQREALRAARGRIDRVDDWLHVGGAVPPADYERLVRAGITRVIDVREEETDDAGSRRTAWRTVTSRCRTAARRRWISWRRRRFSRSVMPVLRSG
jgi:hypothetical protein